MQTGDVVTVAVPAGQVLSLIVPSNALGSIARISQPGDNTRFDTFPLAGINVSFGPYGSNRTYKIRCDSGPITYALSAYEPAIVPFAKKVTTAQAKLCATTPQLIIPAPAANQMIYPGPVLYNIGGTISYAIAAGHQTGLTWGLTSGQVGFDQMFDNDPTELLHGSLYVSGPSSVFPLADATPADFLGQAIYFGSTVNPTAGDGDITISGTYSILTLPP